MEQVNPRRFAICPVAELPPGARRIIEIGGRSIGVFNVSGRYHALRNVCPHQQAPLCQGRVTGTTLPAKPGEYCWDRDGEIIRCPWHGWEFDLTTGKSVFNPHRVRVKRYDVAVEPESELDPSVETYRTAVERDWVVVYL